jgi:hypothetical protein
MRKNRDCYAMMQVRPDAESGFDDVGRCRGEHHIPSWEAMNEYWTSNLLRMKGENSVVHHLTYVTSTLFLFVSSHNKYVLENQQALHLVTSVRFFLVSLSMTMSWRARRPLSFLPRSKDIFFPGESSPKREMKNSKFKMK